MGGYLGPGELPKIKSLLQNIDNFTSYGPLKMRVFVFSIFEDKMEGINNAHFYGFN